MNTLLGFHACCHIIIEEGAKLLKKNKHHSIAYAVAYAETGLRMNEPSGEARVQAAYILCNLSGWRGEIATSVRNSLKLFTREV